MTNILATGLSGLVGTRIASLLTDYRFADLSLSTGIDITNQNQVENAFRESDASFVLHLAALADVDACEKNKELAYKVNVLGTRNIVEACKKFNKKLIHISTDFVFCDDKNEYSEKSKRSSVNYYALTKILAEDEVVNGVNDKNFVILRLSHPYKLLVENEPKKSFFQRMYEILKSGGELTAISDFYSRPTYIDDIASVINKLVKLNLSGTYNCVGGNLLTGFDEAEQICEVFGFDGRKVKQIKLDDYFECRAKRPHKLNLNNDKIERETGVKMRSFREGLLDIKSKIG